MGSESEFEKLVKRILALPENKDLTWLEVSEFASNEEVNRAKQPILEALRQSLDFIKLVEEGAGITWTETERLLKVLDDNSGQLPAILLLPEVASKPEKVVEERKVLFTTCEVEPDQRKEIFVGDEYWTFRDEMKTQYHRTKASANFIYNDEWPRFATEGAIKEAVEVYKWLNIRREK